MFITDLDILLLSEKFFDHYGNFHRGQFLSTRIEAKNGYPAQSLIDFAHAILDRAAECSTLSGS